MYAVAVELPSFDSLSKCFQEISGYAERVSLEHQKQTAVGKRAAHLRRRVFCLLIRVSFSSSSVSTVSFSQPRTPSYRNRKINISGRFALSYLWRGARLDPSLRFHRQAPKFIGAQRSLARSVVHSPSLGRPLFLGRRQLLFFAWSAAIEGRLSAALEPA